MGKPDTCQDAGSLLPDQSKWTHEDKAKKAKNKAPGNYQLFFNTLVPRFNNLAKQLQLGDAVFLLAHASWESGWLNEENTWLHNPFGLTAGGHDNLGFDTFEQAVTYWGCKFGPRVRGAKMMKEFMKKLKGYNTADPDYYDEKRWAGQVHSVQKRLTQFGYQRIQDPQTQTWVYERKPAAPQ
jgi:hypothetical protein